MIYNSPNERLAKHCFTTRTGRTSRAGRGIQYTLKVSIMIYNRPRSIYQYSNMAQNSIFGVVFFVSKSLLGIERQKKLEKFAILTRKPRSHARILIYRTWPIHQLHDS